jgi:hypothetical protein
MAPPTLDQVRLAREFVPGATGVAAHPPLTAAADRPAPRGPTALSR